MHLGDTVYVGGRGTGRLMAQVGDTVYIKLPSGKITQCKIGRVKFAEGN